MSSSEVRRVTDEVIKLVKHLIERCLLLYMRKEEVVCALFRNAKIEPCVTEGVWNRLEEQNEEFFKAYYMRLVLKEQITKFNMLLEKQAEWMRQMSASGSTLPSVSSESYDPPSQNSRLAAASTCMSEFVDFSVGTGLLSLPRRFSMSDLTDLSFCSGNTDQPNVASVPGMNPRNKDQPDAASSHGALSNFGPSLESMRQTIDLSCQSSWENVLPNLLLSQSTNTETIQGINDGMNMQPCVDVSRQSSWENVSPNLLLPQGTNLENVQGMNVGTSMWPSIDVSGQSSLENISSNVMLPPSTNMEIIQGIKDATDIKPAIDVSGQSSWNNVPVNVLLPTTEGIMQAMNCGTMTQDAGYAGEPLFMNVAGRDLLEGPPATVQAPVSSVTTPELSEQPSNATTVDADTDAQPPGDFQQLQRYLSLSDFNIYFMSLM